ncbi:hypothetical protein FC20_GL000312 [Lactobacillus equicursoris DSM 19284 = JCM 14600 = CIP 110162]|uniref:Uncharacterized protein n=1 Tax=Lactobacillus equicursoris DSM 19284 = JCM 14600 = CIP 110162 TaxID=1293597 RepID=A0A0R1LHJ3_9LACO|nr:hypothetical protein FC20_GL000312 [Lactobacillus equicursoris DSM 19284 = JCM 14600 = CIP 110162]
MGAAGFGVDGLVGAVDFGTTGFVGISFGTIGSVGIGFGAIGSVGISFGAIGFVGIVSVGLILRTSVR